MKNSIEVPNPSYVYSLVICGFFVILGLGIGAATIHHGEDHDQKAEVDIREVDMSPIRGEVKPLRLRRTGFVYKCSECHSIFQTRQTQTSLVAEHEDLVLDHGANDYCLNCHHKTNRDVYTDHQGNEIPADQPARLCAKCHGPKYRDWLVGMHGRLEGTWDPTDFRSERLLCIQCHDPHQPKFPKLKPMPGPIYGRVDPFGEES